jgi:hypothetical protein
LKLFIQRLLRAREYIQSQEPRLCCLWVFTTNSANFGPEMGVRDDDGILYDTPTIKRSTITGANHLMSCQRREGHTCGAMRSGGAGIFNSALSFADVAR